MLSVIPPFSPAPPISSPVNFPGAIRQYLKARKIWQAAGAHYLLNDEYSIQVRRDTFRFRIDERYRMGQ